MIGYIFALAVALVVLAFCIAGLAQVRPGSGGGPRGREQRPLPGDAPAADEPTPERSATASRSEIAAAKRHTPPA